MDLKNIGVATVYTNLGDDAVVHALNETRTEIVVTSHELLPRFRKMLPEVRMGLKCAKILMKRHRLSLFSCGTIFYLFTAIQHSSHNIL